MLFSHKFIVWKLNVSNTVRKELEKGNAKMQGHVCVYIYIRGSVKSYKEMRAKKTVIYIDKNVTESVEERTSGKRKRKTYVHLF